MSDLKRLLQILCENNLRLTPHKCQFFQQSLTFLGYEGSADGVRPHTERVNAIGDFPLPDSATDLHRFMGVNSITVPDKYPVPHLCSITMLLHNKRIFSKLDIRRVYLQIPVPPEDIPKTAVYTPFGLFHYLYMPYCLKNAGATFQRMIDTLFANVPNVYCYHDDLLIATTMRQNIYLI